MRNYELVLIIHPELEETAFNELVEKVKSWIVEADGSVTKVDFWGKRKLAYAIRKQNDGQYVQINFQASPELCATLEHELSLNEPIMRFLISHV